MPIYSGFFNIISARFDDFDPSAGLARGRHRSRASEHCREGAPYAYRGVRQQWTVAVATVRVKGVVAGGEGGGEVAVVVVAVAVAGARMALPAGHRRLVDLRPQVEAVPALAVVLVVVLKEALVRAMVAAVAAAAAVATAVKPAINPHPAACQADPAAASSPELSKRKHRAQELGSFVVRSLKWHPVRKRARLHSCRKRAVTRCVTRCRPKSPAHFWRCFSSST